MLDIESRLQGFDEALAILKPRKSRETIIESKNPGKQIHIKERGNIIVIKNYLSLLRVE